MADHIRSLDELQLLITSMYSDERWWDAHSAARELGISSPAAQRALDHLASRNLFDIRITGEVRYRFHPGTDELRAAAHALAEAYRATPVAVINLVAGTSRRSIQDFADAFRIRKHDR
jgi:DNA-binding transcriptional regulator LsrR (DeoR family)